MYGYVRPNREELKIREFELFRSAYCGLCHALRRRGAAARFTVNYDMTFLAMLLSEGEERLCSRRCPRHPVRKRACFLGGHAFEKAADCSVILAWWKLEDDVSDGTWGKRQLARLGKLLLRRAYTRCRAASPDFDALTAEALEKLGELEKEHCESLDKTADCFARILSGIPGNGRNERARTLRELLYHLGRSIYILDAVEDFDRDAAENNYNPLRFRFGTKLTEEDREALRRTLNLSQMSMVSAFLLLGETRFSGVLENTLTVGMPQMSMVVLSGDWKKRKKLLREHTRRLQGV